MKNKLAKLINEKFDIPLEGLITIPSVNIIGNTILDIEGCIGIKKYESDEIIMRAKDYIIKISGRDLTMLTFSHGRINVRGVIFSYQIEGF